MPNTTTTAATIIVSGYHEYWAAQRGEIVAQHVTIEARDLADYAEAEALVSYFPKSSKLRASTLTVMRDRGQDNLVLGSVHHSIKLLADGANGGRNETGIKRLVSILKAAERAGIAVEYRATAGNAIPTLAELLALIGADAELAKVEGPAADDVAAEAKALAAERVASSELTEVGGFTVGQRVIRKLDRKVGTVVAAFAASEAIDANLAVDIEGEVWSGTLPAWEAIEAGMGCGEGADGEHCSPAYLCPACIDLLIAADDARRAAEREYVRDTYGPYAADLLADGWTVDSAISHVTGVCDLELCTGEHGSEWALVVAVATRRPEAAQAQRDAELARSLEAVREAAVAAGRQDVVEALDTAAQVAAVEAAATRRPSARTLAKAAAFTEAREARGLEVIAAVRQGDAEGRQAAEPKAERYWALGSKLACRECSSRTTLVAIPIGERADHDAWHAAAGTPSSNPSNVPDWTPEADAVDLGECAWFAGCGRPATGTTPHPILGDVPTCDRCAKFAGKR